MPVVNGITFVTIGGKEILAANYTDGTQKLLLYDSQIVRGNLVSGETNIAEFSLTASEGIYEEQPANVPLRFNDTTSEIPAGYETANLEAVFTEYNYNPEKALATWVADLYCENVKVYNSNIASGDDSMEVSRS